MPIVFIFRPCFFAMAEARYAVISMELSEQSLESIFLSLTGGAHGDEAAAAAEKEEEH